MKKVNNISIKNEEELDILRAAGKILAAIVQELERSLKSGITTKDVDQIAEKLISEKNVVPAFKGYRGFPGCVCMSINDQIVHGIPSDRLIKDGDIVSMDVGIIYKDFYSDTALSVGIGELSSEHQRLLDVTRDGLHKGIEQAKPGNHLTDISHAIQQYVESHDLAIVREFVGHGIGRNLHEDPEVPNFGPPNAGPLLKSGMVLAIEPMVNLGGWETRIDKDGWTVVTKDGSYSAHFEHSVAITENGPEILTQ